MEGTITEEKLVGLALALGARKVAGWSSAEEAVAARAASVPDAFVNQTAEAIAKGRDPLGDTFCALRAPEARRPMGATYTPEAIVTSMVKWAKAQTGLPARIVDPGAGSGRFVVAAGRKFTAASLIAVELDPVAAILARAHIAASGLGHRAEVILRDYRELRLAKIAGKTLFIGNPPYVRHHLLGDKWKRWLTTTTRERGFDASQLAGLHVHFFLATAEIAEPGDIGVLITAAEWLDVNYGRLVRQLLLEDLGAEALHVIESTAAPFPDAATTAVISCFRIATRPKSIALRRVENLSDLGSLTSGRLVRRERLEAASRWTPLTRSTKKGPEGFVELGELCRVHRGQVTGANRIWIAGIDGADLPDSVLFPSVTKAKELFGAGRVLADPAPLRRVIDLPVDLDQFAGDDRARVNRFIKKAKSLGADKGFIASHRKAWWSVGLRHAAPILATYMARRPPTFVMNQAGARHINIAHGLYPRESLADSALAALADHLSRAVSTNDGRTYAGGLTKFEPKEMERLLVPGPALLAQRAAAAFQ